MQRRSFQLITAGFVCLLLISCAHAPINTPLTQYQSTAGYRFTTLTPDRRPFLVINATNMSLGERFEFIQDQFDLFSKCW